MHFRPHRQLLALLLGAYAPCPNFGVCREALWNPAEGHIPRGFLGATGTLEEVELVMVFAEPGHPYPGDSHASKLDPQSILDSGLRQTYDCFKNGTDLFHRNVREFISQLYPNLSFDEQLRYVWMTEGRLCSIDDEIGATKDRTCATHYLARQIGMLPNANVVAFGSKAKHYMKGLSRPYSGAYSFAPPGANRTEAQPSWEAIINEIQSSRLSR